ncbi:hypothetical protein [Bacillus horti]|uniref:DUF2642 domain-containing protein n=1 Tax=Caldalkalibacillus horti TaxID=77523 RepID=A0ABT9W0R0_9BACI|nr:hypothetical protein [Bacillus horti]MDQ0166685.1 hypothetical protein [Bacillus horti]
MVHSLYEACYSCLGKNVVLQVIDGRELRGVVNHVTDEHIVLSPMIGGDVFGVQDSQAGSHSIVENNEIGEPERGFFNPYIVPLAAIAGLAVVGTAPFWGGGGFGGGYAGYGKPFYGGYGRPGFGYPAGYGYPPSYGAGYGGAGGFFW